MNVVVIGGGIAGVLSAVRLAAAGLDVVLVERDRLGGGATVANHGIVHSGALYAQFHPSIVEACQQAQHLVRQQMPTTVLGRFEALYYGEPARMQAAGEAWTRSGLQWSSAGPDAAIRSWMLHTAGTQCAVIEETVVSSRELMVDLTARALAAGVRILDATPVTGLRRGAGRWVVTTGSGHQLHPAIVVCAAGAATSALLAAAGSARAPAVRSRLEVMVAVPTARPPTPALCLDYGGPTLVPTRTGALISLHGAPRVDITAPTRLVPLARTTGILRAASAAFPALAPHTEDAVAYSCVKTELVDRHADRWGSRPAAAVLDHAGESLPGLFTVVPGKMTLAFSATAELTARILGVPVDLAVPAAGSAEHRHCAEALVAVEPWRSLDDSAGRTEGTPGPLVAAVGAQPPAEGS